MKAGKKYSKNRLLLKTMAIKPNNQRR